MQQEAAQRVQRMQEHARRLVDENQPQRTAESLAAARPPETNTPEEPPATMVKGASATSLFGGDNEQLLLLLLAFLLVRNGADIELIIALLYLAM